MSDQSASAASAAPTGSAAPVPQTALPRRRRADAERNRQALLAVARDAFNAAADEASVSLEQIARDAGVGIATLYRNFPTREALVAALYRHELDELCAAAPPLLAELGAQAALRAWMDRFRAYVSAKREMAETLRAVFAAGTFNLPEIREEMSAAVQVILDAGIAEGTLRDDVRAGDLVASIVGMSAATSLAGGQEQLARMFDLLLDATRATGRDSGPGPSAAD